MLVVLSWWPGVCVSRGGGRAFSGAGFDLDSRGGREDTGTRRHYAKEMVRARWSWDPWMGRGGRIRDILRKNCFCEIVSAKVWRMFRYIERNISLAQLSLAGRIVTASCSPPPRGCLFPLIPWSVKRGLGGLIPRKNVARDEITKIFEDQVIIRNLFFLGVLQVEN